VFCVESVVLSKPVSPHVCLCPAVWLSACCTHVAHVTCTSLLRHACAHAVPCRAARCAVPCCARSAREVLLRSEFAAALAVINAGLTPDRQVMYIPWGEH
jgi:hypothetical protein